MKDYNQIRSELDHKRVEVEQRLNKINEDRRHTNKPLDTNLEEQAVERENDEVLDALDITLRKEVEMINTALARMEQGVYDKCALCGIVIPEERLEALPYTDCCVSCAS